MPPQGGCCIPEGVTRADSWRRALPHLSFGYILHCNPRQARNSLYQLFVLPWGFPSLGVKPLLNYAGKVGKGHVWCSGWMLRISFSPKVSSWASQLEVPPSHNPKIIPSLTEGACSELLDHSNPGAAQLPP